MWPKMHFHEQIEMSNKFFEISAETESLINIRLEIYSLDKKKQPRDTKDGAEAVNGKANNTVRTHRTGTYFI